MSDRKSRRELVAKDEIYQLKGEIKSLKETDEIYQLKGEIKSLKETLERLEQSVRSGEYTIHGNGKSIYDNIVVFNPFDNERCEKVKEAMLHAWNSYEKHAWGEDELQPQSKNGVNSFGGLGATILNSLETLYIMGLKDQFENARE